MNNCGCAQWERSVGGPNEWLSSWYRVQLHRWLKYDAISTSITVSSPFNWIDRANDGNDVRRVIQILIRQITHDHDGRLNRKIASPSCSDDIRFQSCLCAALASSISGFLRQKFDEKKLLRFSASWNFDDLQATVCVYCVVCIVDRNAFACLRLISLSISIVVWQKRRKRARTRDLWVWIEFDFMMAKFRYFAHLHMYYTQQMHFSHIIYQSIQFKCAHFTTFEWLEWLDWVSEWICMDKMMIMITDSIQSHSTMERTSTSDNSFCLVFLLPPPLLRALFSCTSEQHGTFVVEFTAGFCVFVKIRSLSWDRDVKADDKSKKERDRTGKM